MRSFSTNIVGRVKNFPLPKNRPLVPLYETIVNSLHAIEERKHIEPDFHNGKITIDIVRSDQTSFLEGDELPDIEGFVVVDNGIGFNERNMASFVESDSTYKAEIGGKGVGRFSWLKAFSKVSVSSIFKDEGDFVKRVFIFSLAQPQLDDILCDCPEEMDFSTRVTLENYLAEYKQHVPKQANTIALRILQHCLVYFLDENCPEIVIQDIDDTITLNRLFKETVKTESNTISFKIEKKEFSLLNVKVEDRAFPGNRLYLCANNRLVNSKDLEKNIVDLDSQLYERNGFWYIGVLTSSFLDQHVDMNRLSFDIPDSGSNLMNDLSLEAIVNEACGRVEEYLQEYLLPISKEKTQRITDYVTIIAPQFRHLLKYMPEQIAGIKPKLHEEKLDDALYEIKRQFDKSAKKAQKELLDKIDETSVSPDEYEQFFKAQIERISDANGAVLAEYVAHRRVIIELLERGLRRQDNGKFNKEKYMHNLIYPMKTTSDELDYETHNLWLIDEKLSYCSFISSDVPFDNDYKQERTDVLILDGPIAVSDDKNDGTVFDTIIIFELKRPMRNDYNDGENPISQLYGYVRKIREGNAKDKYHRPIRVNESTKFYLYSVCDVTESLKPFIESYSFTPTPDNLGYYVFNKIYNAYFEILSYDKILNDAKKRNRVLFDKLGV